MEQHDQNQQNQPENVDNNSEPKSEEKQYSFFKTIGHIALIFFIGISIYLFVSTVMLIFLTKPDKEVKVPDVTGKRFIDVYNSLVRKGLKPAVRFRDVYDIEDGIILEQYPEKDRVVSENDKIKVVVSRSKLLMDVPNLVGTELPKAINKLRNLHYQGKAISILTGIISYIPSEKVSGNIILAQSPKAKEKMTPDMKINLLVSTGKVAGTQKMPQVVGQSIDLCYDLLAAKGLTVIQQAVVTGVKKLSGRVISQSIRTNAFFKKGQTVVLKVYYYKLKDHPYTAYEKVDYVIPRDQKAGLYEAYIEDHRSKRIRFSRKMRPGQNVFFIFNRSGNAKVTIMNNKKNIWIKEISVE